MVAQYLEVPHANRRAELAFDVATGEPANRAGARPPTVRNSPWTRAY